MKHMRKVFALALTLIMALALTVPAFAADNGEISVENPTIGESYKLYKVFDATYSGTAVSYTIETSSQWFSDVSGEGSPFALAQATATTYYVTLKDNATTGKTIADWLKAHLTGKVQTGDTITPTETNKTVEWTGIDYGYYYVDSTLGAAVTVSTVAPEVVVIDKNQTPSATFSKTVSDQDANYADETSVNYGDTVYYQIDVEKATMYVGEDKITSYTITDTMPAGIALNTDSIKVYVNGAQISTNYTTSNVSAAGFTVVINWVNSDGNFIYNDDGNATLKVKYTGTMDADGTDVVLAGNGNVNTATFKYTTTEDSDPVSDTATVYTYNATAAKVDAADTSKTLMGAEFVLYATKTVDGSNVSYSNPINFERRADGTYYYVPAATQTSTTTLSTTFTTSNGEEAVDTYKAISVEGLEDGTYYMLETKAPNGYNLKTDATNIVLGGVNHVVSNVTIENSTGSLLPSTGGIGTTIFYMVGGILMAGAAILLITKKKMSNEQ